MKNQSTQGQESRLRARSLAESSEGGSTGENSYYNPCHQLHHHHGLGHGHRKHHHHHAHYHHHGHSKHYHLHDQETWGAAKIWDKSTGALNSYRAHRGSQLLTHQPYSSPSGLLTLNIFKSTKTLNRRTFSNRPIGQLQQDSWETNGDL